MEISLVNKLGIKSGMKMIVHDSPEPYEELIGGLPEPLKIYPEKDNVHADFIHVFTRNREDCLNRLLFFRDKMAKNGMIWVSWPKKSSGVKSDVNENVIRDFALELGLVDVKVCSLNSIWSALKLVIRKTNRQA